MAQKKLIKKKGRKGKPLSENIEDLHDEAFNPDDDHLRADEEQMFLDAFYHGEIPDNLTKTDSSQKSSSSPNMKKQILNLIKKKGINSFKFDREIDLHGLNQEEAKTRLKAFIETSLRSGDTLVRIITGKGKHSINQHSVLNQMAKELVRQSYSHKIAFLLTDEQASFLKGHLVIRFKG